jgi:hypothetical protein
MYPRASTPWSPPQSAKPFCKPTATAAHQTWRHVADQLRGLWLRPAALMDDSEHDLLAYKTFLAQHRAKLHSFAWGSTFTKKVCSMTAI